jgi:DNA-binding HxlR family transcriptional regulator/putative sterol carrier protein
MARRSYSQYCAVARGLDLIGDRWTLLMVRDLLLGPKRFKDILESLPGIGTNLLSTRLRELEDAGLIERAVLPPPAGSAVYRLTASGQALETVVVALGRWGGRFLGEPLPTDIFVPSAYFVAMRASFRPERAAALNECYEFRIDGHVFEVAVANGRCTTREGGSTNPTVVASMDVLTLNGLLLEGLRPRDGIADGRIEITGDLGALDSFVQVFAIHPSGELSPV